MVKQQTGSLELMDIKEASCFLNLPVKTIRSLIRHDKIPHTKPAGRLYFNKPELLAWLQNGKQRERKPLPKVGRHSMSNHADLPVGNDPAFWSQLENLLKKLLNEQAAATYEAQLLSPAEAVKVFKPAISTVTLDNWAREGKITKRHAGRNVYYKAADVIALAVAVNRYPKPLIHT